MTVRFLTGDLIQLAEQGEFDIIVHGANCFCTMGSGIARQIKARYPGAYAADCMTQIGDIKKLGNWTQYDTGKFIIINAYTQFDFNTVSEKVDRFEYDSASLIFRKLSVLYGDKRFGLPYIGMGLAGGDRNRIMQIIHRFSGDVGALGGTCTLVEYGV